MNSILQSINTFSLRKNTILNFSFLLVLITLISSCDETPPTPTTPITETIDLNFKFNAFFEGSALDWQKEYVTKSNDSIRFDKIKYILSNFTLKDANGNATEIKNQYAYLSLSDNRTEFKLTGVPKGNYTSFQFNVGLDSVINFGNPAQYALDHPLAPSLTDMHWGWAGGYIFNIIEGYLKNNGTTGGFTFHVATLKNRRTHQFVTNLDLNKTSKLYFKVNADKYFSNAVNHSLKNDGSMSHSGNIDPITDNFMLNYNGTIQFEKYE